MEFMLLLNSIGGAAWETKSETPASLPTHPLVRTVLPISVLKKFCYFQFLHLVGQAENGWPLVVGLWLVSCDKRSHNLCYNRVQFFARRTSVGAYLGY